MPQKGKGKSANNSFSTVSTRHPAARTNARTKRNNFPVRGGLPRGVLTTPELRACRETFSAAEQRTKCE